tara:strand:+ start:506 stop:1225 length:720 start_codon:yes stop_codon:yes gene_type:complete
MQDDIMKNISWRDSNHNFNTKLTTPNKWNVLFDNIDLSEIEIFLKDRLNKIGYCCEIFPAKNEVFNAFKITDPDKLRVVILGQDPYINYGQAMGLAFSVPHGMKIPPSLRNILKKLGKYRKGEKNGDLTHWAEQGVLLLNTSLTVTERHSNSHSKLWKPITDQIIKYISNKYSNIVFMLWGGDAYKKQSLIDKDKHHVLISSHPSPLGCGKKLKEFPSFYDNNHFEECNNLIDGKPINF